MYTITIATMFTIARIVLTPFVVFCMIMHRWKSAVILFIIAASTDFIDGFLARYLNQKTFLGACLDPVADKILICSSFCTLFFIRGEESAIPAWFIVFMIFKEIAQVLGALYLYKKQGLSNTIEAHVCGKIATVVHISCIVWLLCAHFFHTPYDSAIHTTFFAVMSCFMGVSFLQYFFIWLQKIKHKGSSQ
jgi:cardiolipin synthase